MPRFLPWMLLLVVGVIAWGGWALRSSPVEPAPHESAPQNAALPDPLRDGAGETTADPIVRTAAEAQQVDAESMPGAQTEADRHLQVLVLDLHDRPVPDVEVQVTTFLADGRPTTDLAHVRAVVTGSDGVAHFAPTQKWLRGAASAAERGIATWRVLPKVTGSTDLGVAFDPAALPTEPIVLRWPGAGRLRARLVHLGKTLTEHVSLGVYRGDPDDFLAKHAAPRVKADVDGWARFPQVALGGAFNVVAWHENGSIVRTVDAPVVDGQELQVDVPTEGSFVLCGTLLDQDGEPVAGADIRMTYRVDNMGGRTGFSTDGAGRWLCILQAGRTERAALKKFLLTWEPTRGTPLTASAPPRDLRRGITDLGVLQFAPAPLVVAGRLVVDEPTLVCAVRFEVEALPESVSMARPESWRRVSDLAIASDENGAFEVRGAVTATRHRLVFRGREFEPIAPIEFAVGTKDLVVPVSAGHGLRVTLLLPEGLPPSKVLGLLVPQEQVAMTERVARDDRLQVRAVPGDSPQLVWRAQAAGRYSLRVLVDAAQAPIVTLDDVVLPPPEGGEAHLQVDLRQRLRVVRLVVERPAECHYVCVFALPQQDASVWRGASVPGAEVALAVPVQTAELFVLGSDCDPQRVPCPGPQASVRLLPWPKVELRLDGLPALPSGFEYRVRIAPPADDRERAFVADYGAGTIDAMLRLPSNLVAAEGDRAELQVRVGANRLVVNVGEIDGRYSMPLDNIEPAEIQGGRDLAPIRVSASAEAVAAAIESLRKAKQPR